MSMGAFELIHLYCEVWWTDSWWVSQQLSAFRTLRLRRVSVANAPLPRTCCRARLRYRRYASS